MDIKFKGHNHPVQGLATCRLLPQPTPGTEVRYHDEVIGTVDAVLDDELIVTLKPGCEAKFLEIMRSPTFGLSAGNTNCKPGVDL